MIDDDDAFLDDLFAERRQVDAPVSEALLDRVAADAVLVPQTGPAPTLIQSLFDMIGGWPTISGVAMAGMTGLWLGFAPPAAIEDLAAGFIGETTTVSFMGDLGDFVEEGATDG